MIILFITALLILNPLMDHYAIKIKNIWINHTARSVLVLIAYASAFALSYVTEGYAIRTYACIAILLPVVRWISHDWILNHLRGKEWDYLGLGDGKNDAKLDVLLGWFQERTGIRFIVLKLFVLLLSVFLCGVV